MRVFKKCVAIAGGVVGGLMMLLVLIACVFVVFEPVLWSGFYDRARREFDMPGMNDGFVQQGLAFADGVFLTSGYLLSSPSRIYVTDGDGNSRYVEIKDEKGNFAYPHAGGIAVNGDFVYLCASEGKPPKIFVYALQDVLSCEHGGSVTALGGFEVMSNASFCTVFDDVLYVGEYFSQGFPTNEAHHLTTPLGARHGAMVFGYKLGGGDERWGLQDFSADLALSVRDRVQGMCFLPNGTVVLSTSFAIMQSHNEFYSPLSIEPEGELQADGQTLPLWYLDKADIAQDVILPPMAEEVTCVDGRIYVMNESASNRYLFGKFLRARSVWSYAV